MPTTGAQGTVYNVARNRMLTANFVWTTNNKWISAVDLTYVPDETHQTLADVVAQHFSVQLNTPFISSTAWCGSMTVKFPALAWPNPVAYAIISQYVGSNPSDPASYELIACLADILEGPFAPLSTGFIFNFDQSSGQGGWFRP